MDIGVIGAKILDTYQNPAAAAKRFLSNMMGQYGIKPYAIVSDSTNVNNSGGIPKTINAAVQRVKDAASAALGVQQVEILSNGNVNNVSTHQERTVTRNPVEDGYYITDHTFRVPTDITFHFTISRQFTSAIAQVKSMVYDYSSKMLIRVEGQTMPGRYIISAVTIVKDEEGLDTIDVDVSLTEFISVSPSTAVMKPTDVANASDSSTMEAGTRQGSVYTVSDAVNMAGRKL
ncbi:hypothetical protein [Burkholderia phage BCSR129]|nr:hypothetical protein [Burkholderia phage BCSR129]